jgi:hypothetical protein
VTRDNPMSGLLGQLHDQSSRSICRERPRVGDSHDRKVQLFASGLAMLGDGLAHDDFSFVSSIVDAYFLFSQMVPTLGP